MTAALLIAHGCSTLEDVLVVDDRLREWASVFRAQYPEIPLDCGEDVLAIALASTDAEQARLLHIAKLPDEGVLSLDRATEWVSGEQMRLVEQQWAKVQNEAASVGLLVPVGHFLFLCTTEEEGE